jgi:hypothetical protein
VASNYPTLSARYAPNTRCTSLPPSPATLHPMPFQHDFLSMFDGAPLPSDAMRCELAAPVDRFVTTGDEPFCYSVRLTAPCDDFAATVARETRLARERGRAAMEWKTYTVPQPPDGASIAAALRAHGFEECPAERLMFAPVGLAERFGRAAGSSGREASNVTARQVTDAAGFDDFLRINELAFNKREEWLDRELRGPVLAGSPLVRAFVATVDGVPASAGWMQLYPQVAYLFGGGTRPDLRGRGAYRAVVAARMSAGMESGAIHAVSECSPDSERVLRALGFSDGGAVGRWWLRLVRAEG